MVIEQEGRKDILQHFLIAYLCTDQDTVIGNSFSIFNISISVFLLGGLMVHRELELFFSCAMHRSSCV